MMKRRLTLFTAALMLLSLLARPLGVMGQDTYEKVTSNLADWTGEYLLVYEHTADTAYCWTGVDEAACFDVANISNGTITVGSPAPYTTLVMEPMDDGYSIMVNGGANDGKYIYGQNGSNLVKFGNDPALNTLEYSDDCAMIISNTSVMRFNSSSNNKRFRYFKSTSYTNQQPVQLYKKSDGSTQQTVATPTFTPNGGSFMAAMEVTISCATQGATILYTTDGTTPNANSSVYNAPFIIFETTTVKAMATKDGMNNSAVASVTYTLQQQGNSITSIPELWEFAESVGTTATPVSVAFNDWYVTGVRGGQVCVSDGQYGFVIYQSNHGFVAGDKLNGTVNCNVLMYMNHYAELTGVQASDLTVTSGQEMPILTTTIGELEIRNFGTAIDLGTLTYNGSTFEDETGASIALYNQFNLSPNPITSLESGKQYNVKGVSIIYFQGNTQTQQIAPRSADDFEEVAAPVTTVATPTFSPAAGTYYEPLNVTISCATEGATIVYTINGNNPTPNSPVYSSPISISETTTLKAYAFKAGLDDSPIATATYTIENGPTPITIAEARALAVNEYALVQGVVTFVDGKNVYIQDETAGIDLFLNSAVSTLNLGDLVQAYGKRSVYNGLVELSGINPTNQSEFSVISTGNELPLAVKTIAEILEDFQGSNMLQSTRVQIVEATVGTINTSNNTPITQDGNTLNIYKMPVVENLEEGNLITVIGIVGCFNNPQLRVALASDVTIHEQQTDAVATPTFTPGAGTFTSTLTVTINCATEGATIYYTTDGNNPTPNSSVYNAPITISETTTVKAMGVKQGMENSNIASATYTIIGTMTIATARGLEVNEYAMVQGVVTFIEGRNVYIQDATAGIDLYLNNNTVPSELTIGDMVTAYGKVAVYKGLVELSGINGNNADEFSIISSGNDLPLAVKTIAEILEDFQGANMLQSTRVQIAEATIGTINTANNTPITQNGSTMNIFKMPVVEGLLEGDIVTVIGIIGCFDNPQLRINSADDVEFTHPQYPYMVANPTSLSGFNYNYGNGPSQIKYFSLSANNLTDEVHVYPSENYEISLTGGDNFVPETSIDIEGVNQFNNFTVFVRLKAGLEIGSYQESIYASSTDADTVFVAVNGSVTDMPQSSDYVRISDVSQLSDGTKVIFAARFDNNASSYYAMTAQTSGKPEGVLFTSVFDNNEVLPASIVDEEGNFYWTVSTDGTNYTFTNAEGDVLGYTTGTNFSTGGDNTAWTIEYATSGASAMVPEYSGFVITNSNVNNRAFALNSNHNFGPYHTQNMGSDSYNFYLDIFATAGGTPTCAAPTFSPEGGTYYQALQVTISCSTVDATIYYTLDGSDPSINSTEYTNPITVSENTVIKAIAMKEGFIDSNIATAEYTITYGAVTIFDQDWEGDMNGWTFVTVEGSNTWTINTYSGNKFAYANGYNGGANEQWCISPEFNLDNYSDVSLSFRNAKNYSGPDLQLFFSNDYDGVDPSSATWNELSFTKSTGSFAWVESGNIDLASFTGANCYIGFKYISTETEAAAWEIDDIALVGFTSNPTLTVSTNSLSGFSYLEGNGPSAEQSFVINGMNLNEPVTLTSLFEAFEISLTSGEGFEGEPIELTPQSGAIVQTIYVRMVDNLDVGNYSDVITIESEIDDITINLSGMVVAEGSTWNRILSLDDLNDGDQVIIASRYDATVGDGYYAMTAGVSGKPEGVLFTSESNNGVEMLPSEIATDADTYRWTVTLDGNTITLVNAAGDALGYNTSTNFSGNENVEWNIVFETSSDNAQIPNYAGFIITNAEVTNRGIAKNSFNNFGAYSTSNLNNVDYNFYLDLFVQGGSATPTVAKPVFSMPSGTYYEEIDVEISCSTEDAIIYYTTDGTNPTAASNVYSEAIHIDHSMTLKAIAMKEGFDNSAIATANYMIHTGSVIILSQDWEGDMDGWTFVTVQGNKPWTIGNYAGNNYANANGYNDNVANEQWCISPAFNLNDYAGMNVTLSFKNATKFDGPALELFIADDYDGRDPTAASWQPLSYIPSDGNYNWTESGEISLNSFSGAYCNIGFKYTSTASKSAASWEIDDILVIADMGENPYLIVTPNILTGFRHYENEGPSGAQTFELTGGNLPPAPGSSTGAVEISVNTAFYELSLDGVNYSSNLTIEAVGALEPTTVYVRLNGGAMGHYDGVITISDFVETTVTLRGDVIDVTSVEEDLAENVMVWSYNNEIMVENNSGNTLNLTVYNVLGQQVLNKAVDTGSIILSHNLSRGLYVITLSNNLGTVSTKMVVR